MSGSMCPSASSSPRISIANCRSPSAKAFRARSMRGRIFDGSKLSTDWLCTALVSVSANSLAVANRWRGCLAMALWITRLIRSLTAGLISEAGGGMNVRTASAVSPSDFRAKGLRPVSVSYPTTPSENTSESAVAGCNSSCSGAMYCRVPLIPVTECVPVRCTTPKSMIFAVSSSRTKMLLGLRSRCTRPRSCAACKPRQVCTRISTTRFTVRRWLAFLIRASSVLPGSIGITKYGLRRPFSSYSPVSRMSTMFGWLRPARTVHSLANRSSAAGSAMSRMVLMATSRFVTKS